MKIAILGEGKGLRAGILLATSNVITRILAGGAFAVLLKKQHPLISSNHPNPCTIRPQCARSPVFSPSPPPLSQAPLCAPLRSRSSRRSRSTDAFSVRIASISRRTCGSLATSISRASFDRIGAWRIRFTLLVSLPFTVDRVLWDVAYFEEQWLMMVRLGS